MFSTFVLREIDIDLEKNVLGHMGENYDTKGHGCDKWPSFDHGIAGETELKPDSHLKWTDDINSGKTHCYLLLSIVVTTRVTKKTAASFRQVKIYLKFSLHLARKYRY